MWLWRFDHGSPRPNNQDKNLEKKERKCGVWGIDLLFPSQEVYYTENHKEN